MPADIEREFLKLNTDLNSLAQDGNALAAFSYAKDLYTALRDKKIQGRSEYEIDQLF